jgi:predicted unusual protein kinase regulating ubiquinone biosynthesis (AarF/ABC1/UbiB family)
MKQMTGYLRSKQLIPNESTTEELIHYLVNQALIRSPIQVPDVLVSEFWHFFQELFSDPEIKGLAELNLDIARLVLETYEPLLVDLINLVKELQTLNRRKINGIVKRVSVVRGDIKIIRRQIRALRYIKPFLQTDPRDFSSQAQIVAAMVREFGPFFIKMAQVAAANADFLPGEIARELAVFQEDVAPMSPDEVIDAFRESFGCYPHEMYFDFKPEAPLKSGSIGSVYLARKPVIDEHGRQTLKPVIVKIGRHNLEREFLMGKTAIGLVLLSSHYWAPHSKIAPFLEDLLKQVNEFVVGFEQELDFETEADIQTRFHEKSIDIPGVHVPEVYRSTRRIIEMEFAAGAVSVNRAVEHFRPADANRFRRTIARRFLNAVLTHVFVHKEFHGDLHPGNVLVKKDMSLVLVDWGNSVRLEGKWRHIWNYAQAAVLADVDRLADALIAISTDPEGNARRKRLIQKNLGQVLKQKGIASKRGDFLQMLLSEGLEGLLGRLHTSAQLLSKSQQVGIVVSSEYLHLSRSIFALLGTFANLYNGLPVKVMVMDCLKVMADFPVHRWLGSTDSGATLLRTLVWMRRPGRQKKYRIAEVL